jgi:prepilin-type N-terminal cleavage/methylation domain-containing protein
MVGSRRRHGGFTLLELLVVIAIVAVVLALALAGVQRVRLAANRTICSNNLRQLGLGYQNYRVAHDVLPPLVISNPSRLTGWGPFILPYIEQDTLANRYDFTVPFYAPGNQAVISTRLKVFQCPSAPARTASQDPYTVSTVNAQGAPISWQASPADYSPLRAVGIVLVVSGYCNAHKTTLQVTRFEGPLNPDEGTRLSDIGDGASNTILLAEIAGRPQLWQAGRSTGDLVDLNTTSFGGWGDGSLIPTLVGSSADGTQFPGPCGINCSNAYGLYSFHNEGVNTVFVDASVHFLRKDVSMHDVLLPLITANGGETVPDY